jgi:hypothetical protein
MRRQVGAATILCLVDFVHLLLDDTIVGPREDANDTGYDVANKHSVHFFDSFVEVR